MSGFKSFSAWLLVVLAGLVVLGPALLEFAHRNAAGWVAQKYEPNQLSEDQFRAPSSAHWFGTDVHGRDLFSRVIYGTRISMLVGITGAAVSLVMGVMWGAVAGYAGGRVDAVMMRVVDIMYSLPSIIFVIVLITVFGGKVEQWLAGVGAMVKFARLLFLVAGLGAVSWLTMARIVRGQVLSLRERSFVEASRVLGAGPWRILSRHIIPHTTGLVIVYLMLTVPAIILYESFLSYLGLGIQPPMASLGSLIAEGADQINPIRSYWWLIAFPGGLLVIILLALNFFGDGLRDAWEERER